MPQPGEFACRPRTLVQWTCQRVEGGFDSRGARAAGPVGSRSEAALVIHAFEF
jgi:hypothetical protein